MPHAGTADGAPFTAARRAALSAQFPGRTIVVPAGRLKPRANDTDYAFRAATAFTWLTGETEAEAVLVMTPGGGTHRSTLYVHGLRAARRGRSTSPAARTARCWVGNVPSPAETPERLAIETRPLSALADDLAARSRRAVPASASTAPSTRLLARGDDTELAAGARRTAPGQGRLGDRPAALGVRGDRARIRRRGTRKSRSCWTARSRGERWLEGTFWRRARLEGNEVGYGSIVGAGAHGTTLHWWRNHGAIECGQLLLADMGVETDELYTADVTRTMPVTGEWTPDQLKVYNAVREAQAAGIARSRPARTSWRRTAHRCGCSPTTCTAGGSCRSRLPSPVDEDPERPGAGLHRRYTLHGTSHMLGIDVHDCALARHELYKDGPLAAGYVLTVEPGLYFQVNDRTVPPELRGLATRIEDDIVVTDGEPVNLSQMLPRDPGEITAWMREVQAQPSAF